MGCEALMPADRDCGLGRMGDGRKGSVFPHARGAACVPNKAAAIAETAKATVRHYFRWEGQRERDSLRSLVQALELPYGEDTQPTRQP